MVKRVARRNARLLEKHAGRRAPEIKRVVQEVRGTFEKVYDDTAEALEGILNKCMLFSLSPVVRPLMSTNSCAARPRISEVVQETKSLIQQSREKLVIS